ncbi:hypothetical protein ACF063_43375 [Streptomyces chartreusis]|uniref:hypothetical protein n=1 Tax=Streptomyces chartreusis TaxID=1969 RepID=UPI0036FF516F
MTSPRNKFAQAAKPAVTAIETAEEAIVQMALGRRAGVRLLFGMASDATNLVASRVGRVAVAHEAFADAHWWLVGSGDDAARIVFRKAARALRSELRAATAEAPDLAKDAQRALREVDDIARRVRSRSGRLASGRINPNWWDRLFELSRTDPTIRTTLAAFQDACTTGGTDTLTTTAQQLLAAVSKKVSMSKSKAFADRINGVVRRLSAGNLPGDGTKALAALDDFVDQLDPSDPVRTALVKLAPAVRDNGDRWRAIADVVAGMKRATTPEEADALVWRLKGLIGEMALMSTLEYRARLAAALRDADALVKRLNAILSAAGPIPPGSGWEVRRCRSHVRAPATADSARLAPFYDDTIIVRRTVLGRPHGDAMVMLATQVKSGDWSAARVVDQIATDIRREGGGLIELDGLPHQLSAVPDEFRTVRIFVGTSLPPPEAVARSTVPIETILLPMSGDELKAVALGLLQANGLLP